MNIFEAIRADHDTQRDLCKKILDTEGKSDKRATLFKKLKEELDVHAIAEERDFYVPLIEHDMTQEHARHGIAEHHELDELIEKVENADMDTSAWLAHFKNLADKVHHHLEDEERTIFQLAGKVLTEKEKELLANRYKKSMEEHRP